MQDLENIEHAAPGQPIFQRKFAPKALFNPVKPKTGPNAVNVSDLKQITRDWVTYDLQTKINKTMQSRVDGWGKNIRFAKYKPSMGFAKTPCFDPAPYNETGFPMSPRL